MLSQDIKKAKTYWNSLEMIDRVQQLHAIGVSLQYAEKKLHNILPKLTGYDKKILLNNIMNKEAYNWEPTN
jgi:hypothetical protein